MVANGMVDGRRAMGDPPAPEDLISMGFDAALAREAVEHNVLLRTDVAQPAQKEVLAQLDRRLHERHEAERDERADGDREGERGELVGRRVVVVFLLDKGSYRL